MRYRTQSVAYAYFAVALLLLALQLAFGFLSAAKYLGPDPLRAILPFDVTKTIHTNLLVVWVLTGFLGAAYYVVPEESKVELYSTRLAYIGLALLTALGVTAVVGYLFGWTAGNKLLEQPLPIKLGIVVVMLIFAYNIVRTMARGGRVTVTEGMVVGGLFGAALLYLPSVLHFDNYTIATFYRWWTIHLWVEGVFELIQGGLLAFLLIRLTGIDRTTVEKWLFIIVGLTFVSGLLGTAHHYFWIGVPGYWLPLGGFFSALEPLPFFGMAILAYLAVRRMNGHQENRVALHWAVGSAMMAAVGAGLLGLAHTWPAVNQWTHGTLITPMHGHMAFYGAYGMIILAMVSYTLPHLSGHTHAAARSGGVGLWAFWLQVVGITGMTLAFGAAGIAQVYMERIMGVGYLDTQLKLQVHFQMLLAAALVFAVGVGLYLWDFFVSHPRLEQPEPVDPAEPVAAAPAGA